MYLKLYSMNSYNGWHYSYNCKCICIAQMCLKSTQKNSLHHKHSNVLRTENWDLSSEFNLTALTVGPVDCILYALRRNLNLLNWYLSSGVQTRKHESIRLHLSHSLLPCGWCGVQEKRSREIMLPDEGSMAPIYSMCLYRSHLQIWWKEM